MRAHLAAVAALLAAASIACQANLNTSPTPAQPAASAVPELHCAPGDQPVQEPVQGWGFCMPVSWAFRERGAPSDHPPGTDLTFDITETATGASRGLFAFVIVGTYERGSAPNLAGWLSANAGPDQALAPIQWGNAKEAASIEGTSKRYALTPTHVVLLDVHQGAGNLDADTAMAQRLSTWKFSA